MIRNGAAYFTVYTKDYCLIMEDIYGNRFCEEIGCCEEPLMDIDHCVKKCTELAQENYPIFYIPCSKKLRMEWMIQIFRVCGLF